MEQQSNDAKDAKQATSLLVTVATTLNERLAVTADELARSQKVLRDDTVQQPADRNAEYGVVLDHLYRAVQHLQSHDLVNQLIDAQKLRVDKMREKLGEALTLAHPPLNDPAQAEQWIERSRAMLDCIVAGIAQIDEASGPRTDKKSAGSVDLF